MNPYAPPTARVADPPHEDRPSAWVTQLLALVFAFFALYSGWSLLYQLRPFVIAVACLSGVASLGLWRKRRWSRWVVYLISALLCVYFAWYGLAALQDGWPYGSATRASAALIPAALFLLFGVAASVYVAQLFPKR